MLAKKLLTLSLIFSVSSFILSNPAYARKATNTLLVTQTSITDIETNARNIIVKVHVGDNRASGVLVANNSNTYTVITNAHVVSGAETFNIETPDGIKHNATLKIKDGKETGNDLAILEFNSNEQYHTAKLRDSSSVRLGDRVIAAGFPYNKQNILISDGSISLITDKPLKKGYQIGFTNETTQGMSGGILLNEKGEVIGILGKGKDTLFDTAYDYQDGTQPNPQDLATMRKAAFSVPISNITELSPQLTSLVKNKNNLNLASTVSNFSANTLTPNSTTQAPKPEYTGIVKTVDDIAEQITVRIDTVGDGGYQVNGSGVIIAKQGNTYYVATAKHLLQGQEEVKLFTPKEISHQIDKSTIILSEAYDFAVFSFESEEDYQVATLGDYTVAATQDQAIFLSGFSDSKDNNFPQRLITGGKVKNREQAEFFTKDRSSFTRITPHNQGLLYSNIGHRGMSGGALLDIEGKLVGIHNGGEGEVLINDDGYQEINLGLSVGISSQDILFFLQTKTNLNSITRVSNDSTVEVGNDNWQSIKNHLFMAKPPDNDANLAAWMNYGNQLWRYEKYSEAIKAFEKAIEIDSNFDQAYYVIGLVYWYQRNYLEAIPTLNKAIEIEPKRYYYWRYLASSYEESKQYEPAILAYQKAIEKNSTSYSKDFTVHHELGNLLTRTQRYPEALETYERAISLNPEYPNNYYNRGIVYYHLDQHQKASQDLIKFISLNSEIKRVNFIEVDTLVSPSNNIFSNIDEESNDLTLQTNKNANNLVEEIDNVARQITVRIGTTDTLDNTNHEAAASGVIIAKQDNTYYGLTAKHAISKSENKLYDIVTQKEIVHRLDKNKISYLSDSPLGLDIALFSFESKENYNVATIGDYEPDNNWVFTSGFTTNDIENKQRVERIFTGGRLYPKESRQLFVRDTYFFDPGNAELLYTNMSYPGMSGGAILDREGRLIGINIGISGKLHFNGKVVNQYSDGLSLGESISDFLNELRTQELDLKEDWLNIETETPIKLSTSDIEIIQNQLLSFNKENLKQDLISWLNYGNQLWRVGKYSEAVKAFEQAIKIDPTFADAYYLMGLAYLSQQEWQKSLDAFTEAKEINPNYYPYWRYLGLSHNRLRNYRKSLNAYIKAINFKSDDFVLHFEQGNTLKELKRYSEAVSVYGEAIKLNPYHPWSYYNRGIVHYEIGNYDEASADLIKAISLNAQIKTIR